MRRDLELGWVMAQEKVMDGDSRQIVATRAHQRQRLQEWCSLLEHGWKRRDLEWVKAMAVAMVRIVAVAVAAVTISRAHRLPAHALRERDSVVMEVVMERELEVEVWEAGLLWALHRHDGPQ